MFVGDVQPTEYHYHPVSSLQAVVSILDEEHTLYANKSSSEPSTRLILLSPSIEINSVPRASFLGEGLQDNRKMGIPLLGVRIHIILMILWCTVLTFLWSMSSQPAVVQPSSVKACGAISEYPSMLHRDRMVCYLNRN